MKTWLLCEAAVHAEATALSPRKSLIKECSDCAMSCFAVISNLVGNAGDLSKVAFNCFLHCRQCSDECVKYDDEDIQFCGLVSSICADTLKEMTVINLN